MNETERPYVRVHPDDLDRIARERDEARAVIAGYANSPIGLIATEAEARGYRRGVKEAAAKIGGYPQLQSVILALLE